MEVSACNIGAFIQLEQGMVLGLGFRIGVKGLGVSTGALILRSGFWGPFRGHFQVGSYRYRSLIRSIHRIEGL